MPELFTSIFGTFGGSNVGFGTIDFSGRRFRAGFNVTLPPDFYAAAYGEAKMLLDAAYSEAIDQNSQLVIYVNGVSSTSVKSSSVTASSAKLAAVAGAK